MWISLPWTFEMKSTNITEVLTLQSWLSPPDHFCINMHDVWLTVPASVISVHWTWVWLAFSNRSLASNISFGLSPYSWMARTKLPIFSSCTKQSQTKNKVMCSVICQNSESAHNWFQRHQKLCLYLEQKISAYIVWMIQAFFLAKNL